MRLFISLLIYLSINQCSWLFACMYVFMSVCTVCLCTFLRSFLLTSLLPYLPTYLPIYIHTYLSTLQTHARTHAHAHKPFPSPPTQPRSTSALSVREERAETPRLRFCNGDERNDWLSNERATRRARGRGNDGRAR